MAASKRRNQRFGEYAANEEKIFNGSKNSESGVKKRRQRNENGGGENGVMKSFSWQWHVALWHQRKLASHASG
jgi:hypothetical protein